MYTDTTQRGRTAKRIFPLIAKRIDSVPAPAAVLARITELLDAEQRTSAGVAEIVGLSAAVAAKVLKLANSPFYGSEHRVSTLSHAVAMLGQSAVRSLVAGIAASPEEPDDGLAIDRLRLWRHDLATAAAAEAIAREVEYDLPEEAWAAGLLHDLGRAVLDTYSPAEYWSTARESSRAGLEELERERRLLGMDHSQVGALVAESWHLPRILRNAVRFHHDPGERRSGLPPRHRMLVAVVAAADRLCVARGHGCFPESLWVAEAVACGGRLITPDRMSVVAAEVDRVLAEADRRLGIEGPDAVAELAAGAGAARERLARSRAEPPALSRLKRAAESLRPMRELGNVEEVLKSAVRLIREGLAFDRVMFLHVEVGEARLLGRHMSEDTNLDADIRWIDLPLSQDGLLASALRDGVAVRVDNWTTDGALLRLLGHSEVVVAPVVANHRPLGVLCADHAFCNREISEADTVLLGLLANDLGLCVEHVVLDAQAVKLRTLAAKDDLTGVNNRRTLMELLQKEIDRARRYGSPLSVVMLDIDDFKSFNDTYGHQAGDTVLAEVAQLTVASSRDVDVNGRYGGEEFMVVLPETWIDQAIVYAERLRKAVAELGVKQAKTWPACPLTISLGVTSLRPGDDDLERLIRRVDLALYAAKDRGRNRVCAD